MYEFVYKFSFIRHLKYFGIYYIVGLNNS